jgi:hypothetical protein
MVVLTRYSWIKLPPILISLRSRPIDRLVPSGYVAAVLLNEK